MKLIPKKRVVSTKLDIYVVIADCLDIDNDQQLTCDEHDVA